MKKFLMLVLLVVFSICITYGQTIQDSTSTYNKLNKWAVVKLTIAYMDDYVKNTDEEKETYNNQNSKYLNFREDVNLDDFEVALSQGWKTTREKIYKKYKNELVDTILTYNFKDVSFKPKGKENSRTQVLNLINRKYDSLIAGNIKPISIKQTLEKGREDVDIPTPPIESSEINFIEITIYILLGISIFLNIFFFSQLRAIKKKKNKRVTTYDPFYEGENKSLKDKIALLEIENKTFKNKIIFDPQKPISTNHVDENKGEERKPVEDKKSPTIEFNVNKSQNYKKTIYLPSPFEDRRFAVEDVSEIEKPTSLYIAEVDPKNNKGIISLIETADLTRALNSPNTFLETVCDYENQYNPLAKGIKVVTDGEVCLEGEDWVVKRKIRIKFI